MSRRIVLSLCDRTGNMVTPWLAAGYECWIVDNQHEPGEHREENLVRVGADVRTWLPPRQEFVVTFAFPPCTHLARSGARWFKDKGLAGLAHGLEIVDRCRAICEWTEGPWMLENPVGTLSTYWRKPDYTFDPCDFGGYLEPPGDAYKKKTCLWAGGGFHMPEARAVVPMGPSPIWYAAPGEDRGDRRSVTPPGFALAVFQANQQPHVPLYFVDDLPVFPKSAALSSGGPTEGQT